MDAVLSRLPETLTALAALVAAIAAAITSVNRSRIMAKIEAIDIAQQLKLDSIGQKVDGGVSRLHDMLAAGQGALADIAQTAVEQQPAKEVVVKAGERKHDPIIPRGPKP